MLKTVMERKKAEMTTIKEKKPPSNTGGFFMAKTSLLHQLFLKQPHYQLRCFLCQNTKPYHNLRLKSENIGS